jgi:phosphoribosylaminoimidazole (AIR) synthetase
MEQPDESVYVPTGPQKELIDRLGLELDPKMDKVAVTSAIDKATRLYVAKVCQANPALKKNGHVTVDGVTRRISQIRGHRVQLSGGGKSTEWVTFFDIENVPEAEAPPK